MSRKDTDDVQTNNMNNCHIQVNNNLSNLSTLRKEKGESSKKTTINKAEKKALLHGQHAKESSNDSPRWPPFWGKIFLLICRNYEPNHNFCFKAFTCNLK
eukprot:1703879-Ditylum_brightwellii.AAC.1